MKRTIEHIEFPHLQHDFFQRVEEPRFDIPIREYFYSTC